ncbi:DUF368 domain-containing protein [Parashewanella curva]|uniref:DUF368 domain-containing protein n=1 Tax=Parashewanella curva TaxID=2338552 RepID=A0A3L8Q1W8_9GAMM|nr:DUF368 domain-containing protein [Parashewanella curva]RLV61656.1 DUF368 domain-containing protein [Parashewanella curva]
MNLLKTYFKGVAMGAADVVPGVSGGTIAFITGILDTLLGSITKIKPSLIGMIKRDGVKATFDYINGSFLVSLFAGILTSIFTLAKLISWLLVTHPIPIWSFFFGLILISAVHVLKQINGFSIQRLACFVAGVGIAWGLNHLTHIGLEINLFTIFIGGSIAICAMILPGISGSFLLLLLGLYSTVLGAAKSFDITTLAVFAAGAVCGLLSFSRFLSMLLTRWHDATLAFLTGLMLGTLGKIWPWKITQSWRMNSKGEQVPLIQENLSPFAYQHATGESHQLILAVICMLSAIVLVLGLEKIGRRSDTDTK